MKPLILALITLTLLIFSPSRAEANPIPLDEYTYDGSSVWGTIPKDMISNDDGTIFLRGSFTGVVDLDPTTGIDLFDSATSPDYITKINPDNSYGWTILPVGNGNYLKTASDSLGNLFYSGRVELDRGSIDFDPTAGEDIREWLVGNGEAIYVTKVNSEGGYEWTVLLSHDEGSGFSYANSIHVDVNNNISLVGMTVGLIDIDPGVDQQFVGEPSGEHGLCVVLDSLGNLVWGYALGEAEGFGTGRFHDVSSDSSGNLVIAGILRLFGSNIYRLVVIKHLPNGDVLWQIESGDYVSFGPEIAVDQEGNIFVSAVFQVTREIFPGYTLSSQYGHDVYFAKIDATGNVVWVKTITSSGNVSVRELRVDSEGNLYLCGSFGGWTDFNPDVNAVDNILQNGKSDGFVMKLDANDNYLGTLVFTGPSTAPGFGEMALGIESLPGNQLAVYGTYRNGADLDPTEGIDLYSEINGRGAFLSRLTGPVTPNQAPIADAGTNQLVKSWSIVTLDGLNSFDPDSGPSPLQYEWTAPANITLSDSSSSQPTFTAPRVPFGSIAIQLEFSLRVFDGTDWSEEDSVTITVRRRKLIYASVE